MRPPPLIGWELEWVGLELGQEDIKKIMIPKTAIPLGGVGQGAGQDFKKTCPLIIFFE